MFLRANEVPHEEGCMLEISPSSGLVSRKEKISPSSRRL